MKCRQAQELMGAYLYGDLAPEEMRELRVHAQDCTLCREDLATRGKVVSSLGDVTPELSDADRQRIAWSVKGAVRKKEARNRPSIFRLVPALGLAAAVLAAGFMAGRFATRTPQHAAHSAKASDQSKPKIEIKETTPDPSKISKVPDQVLDALQSIFSQAAAPSGLNRQSEPGSRHLSGRASITTPPDSGVKALSESKGASTPATTPNNSGAALKDSGMGAKKVETDVNAGDTKLPRVTDPKNAETTPSESQ